MRKVLQPHEQALVILSEAFGRIQKEHTEVREHVEYIEKVEEDLVELKDVDFIKLKHDFEEFRSTVEAKLTSLEEKMPNSSLFEVHAEIAQKLGTMLTQKEGRSPSSTSPKAPEAHQASDDKSESLSR